MTKSPVFAPVRVTLLIVNGPVPQFVIVTLCTRLVVPTSTLPKLMMLALAQTAGTGMKAVPVTAISTGLTDEVLKMSRMLERVPEVVGAKLTEKLHVPPGAMNDALVQF
jgi:hypothetical protein